MEKRILIAFLLSFAVLYGFRFLYPPAPVPEKPADTKVAPPESPAPAPAAVVRPKSINDEVLQADSAKDVQIETAVFRAVVSNEGGILKSLKLKEYLDAKTRKDPVELIDPYAGRQVGFPWAFATGDPALDKILSQAKFVVQQEAPYKVSLDYRAEGIQAHKTFDFDPEKYLVGVSSDLQKNGTPVPHQIVWQGRFGDQSIPDAPAKRMAVYETAGKFQRVALAGIKAAQEVTALSAGVEDQYFLAMFIRDKEDKVKIDKQDYVLPDLPDGTKGTPSRGLYVAVPGTDLMKVYIGPKLERALVQAHPRLGGVINYGFFAIIARPLLIGLRWIHGFIGNWGWAIIILTLLINMILFPLRIKQQTGMQKMQKNMPHLKQLQEKYKKLKPGDPRRAEVEKELMQMNKQQLSGCLPTLLQFPLLFAFINMMNVAIELRGAPWVLWIRDLSLEDPLFILPILMGVAMFVQMKMSPTSPDPAQAKMMLITPVLVTVLFLWYRSASGLTLYWLTGNVIGIGQQWFVRKYWSSGDDNKPPGQKRQPVPA
jgi:YidC/Oxa1 family membrane protein insertase